MDYKSIKGFTGWGQLGVLFVFLGLGVVLTGIVQTIIGFSLVPAGTSLEKMTAAMPVLLMEPQHVGALRLSQVLGTLCFFFIPTVIYSLITNGKSMFWLGFNKYLNVLQVIIAFGIIYAANVCAGPLADLTKSVVANFPSIDVMAKKMEDTYNAQVIAMSNLKSWPEYLMALMIMAFFPAMFEEVFFRGGMQNLLVKWWKKPLLAIIVTSLIFSVIHMSIYLFLSRAVLGIVLGLLYHKGKNLWVNIIAHFLNNAIAVTALFYMSRQKLKLDVAKLEPKVGWAFGIAGLVGLIVLFIVFEKVSAGNVVKINTKENLLRGHQDPLEGFAQNI